MADTVSECSDTVKYSCIRVPSGYSLDTVWIQGARKGGSKIFFIIKNYGHRGFWTRAHADTAHVRRQPGSRQAAAASAYGRASCGSSGARALTGARNFGVASPHSCAGAHCCACGACECRRNPGEPHSSRFHVALCAEGALIYPCSAQLPGSARLHAH